MRLWAALLHNEVLKLWRRRRPHLVLVLLTAFLGIAAWAQDRQLQNQRAEARGGADWRTQVESRIASLERGAERRRIFVGFTRFQRFEAGRLRYHLAHDLDPWRQTGPLFSRAFAALASTLLLPLLVTVLAADIVSAEVSAGTIKMLLTRPVARWKVLASKLVVVVLFASLLVAVAALLSWLIGGLAFGWRGWSAPVFAGFRFTADGVDTTAVRCCFAPAWAPWGR
jgi:ABC-2 type transport system permease protein